MLWQAAQWGAGVLGRLQATRRVHSQPQLPGLIAQQGTRNRAAEVTCTTNSVNTQGGSVQL